MNSSPLPPAGRLPAVTVPSLTSLAERAGSLRSACALGFVTDGLLPFPDQVRYEVGLYVRTVPPAVAAGLWRVCSNALLAVLPTHDEVEGPPQAGPPVL
jgi:hypothetical protein